MANLKDVLLDRWNQSMAAKVTINCLSTVTFNSAAVET
jgi:hypothetical protein